MDSRSLRLLQSDAFVTPLNVFATHLNAPCSSILLAQEDVYSRVYLIVGKITGETVFFPVDRAESVSKFESESKEPITAITAGDVRNTGKVEVVTVSCNGHLQSLRFPHPTKLTATPIPTRVFSQQVNANVCAAECFDIDGDGLNEFLVVMTDRVVRSYRFDQLADCLVPQNKWEMPNQISGWGLGLGNGYGTGHVSGNGSNGTVGIVEEGGTKFGFLAGGTGGGDTGYGTGAVGRDTGYGIGAVGRDTGYGTGTVGRDTGYGIGAVGRDTGYGTGTGQGSGRGTVSGTSEGAQSYGTNSAAGQSTTYSTGDGTVRVGEKHGIGSGHSARTGHASGNGINDVLSTGRTRKHDTNENSKNLQGNPLNSALTVGLADCVLANQLKTGLDLADNLKKLLHNSTSGHFLNATQSYDLQSLQRTGLSPMNLQNPSTAMLKSLSKSQGIQILSSTSTGIQNLASNNQSIQNTMNQNPLNTLSIQNPQDLTSTSQNQNFQNSTSQNQNLIIASQNQNSSLPSQNQNPTSPSQNLQNASSKHNLLSPTSTNSNLLNLTSPSQDLLNLTSPSNQNLLNPSFFSTSGISLPFGLGQENWALLSQACQSQYVRLDFGLSKNVKVVQSTVADRKYVTLLFIPPNPHSVRLMQSLVNKLVIVSGGKEVELQNPGGDFVCVTHARLHSGLHTVITVDPWGQLLVYAFTKDTQVIDPVARCNVLRDVDHMCAFAGPSNYSLFLSMVNIYNKVAIYLIDLAHIIQLM
ncbi:unnamed protein product [Bursaphelenchus okinawaensis]|uniref:Uncharacterized protein n=1 Tax=Bursaphelenchus okinawaensis TaxID=465554 RepID=A0A811LJ50_9BILA|nr:unnamed protein product [Bursaphelenchus okinawaensis]CAG9123330.1 unnamed protein product [Bursaphelenchus okinawaensis]